MGRRLLALIVKELLVILRDPRGRMVIIVPPILQLLIFSFAATLEVSNVTVAVLDMDGGRWSRELVQRIEATPTVAEMLRPASLAETRDLLERQEVLAAIVIAPDFGRAIERGATGDVQILLDGRRSNAAQIFQSYVAAIVDGLASEIAGRARAEAVAVRHLYNPNLDYIWFTVPSLIAIITMMIGLIVTALSVARERELGTFDQLLVAPLRPFEILVGKAVPALLIGTVHGTLYIAAALWLFGIPLTGSLPLLYLAMILYMLAVVGVGLFISSLAATQQQAILGVFVFTVPAFLLSGFASPIDNMPEWLQAVTLVNPPRWFLVIARGVFLKDLPADAILANLWPLLPIAAATLAAAALLFRARSA